MHIYKHIHICIHKINSHTQINTNTSLNHTLTFIHRRKRNSYKLPNYICVEVVQGNMGSDLFEIFQGANILV